MATQNLTIYRGVTYPMTYTHTSAMTGGTVYFTVKTAISDSDATDTAALVSNTVTSFTSGDTIASWTVTDDQTYIDPGTYHYDILYRDSTGVTWPPIFEGKIKVLPHPTNRNI